MIGELGGLGCAPLWALSSILLKSQTDRLDAVRINALRTAFASVFVVAIVPIFGRTGQLSHLSLSAILYLWLSVIIGLVVGDTLYIKGMGIIGVSRALPISITYPIFMLPFSVTVVGEKLSVLTVAGVFVTVSGLYLITAPQRGAERMSGTVRKQYWRGIFLLLAASLCWAVGTTILNFAMIDMDPIVAGAIRMPFMAVILFTIAHVRKSDKNIWHHGFRSLTTLALAGILGIGVGGLLFMVGIKYAGPARTAILSSTAPMFGVPLSMFMLHEKITPKTVLGTVLCMMGIWFVI